MATGVFAVQRSKLTVPIAKDEAGLASRASQRRARILRAGRTGARFHKLTVNAGGASPLV
jgi:hypothetical protein